MPARLRGWLHQPPTGSERAGVRYGRRQDLNHDLLRILDAAGTLVMKNTFEPDPTSPAFDSVVTQRDGDLTLTFHSATWTPNVRASLAPPNGPPHQFVGELANIDYLDVCPRLTLGQGTCFNKVLPAVRWIGAFATRVARPRW